MQQLFELLSAFAKSFVHLNREGIAKKKGNESNDLLCGCNPST